MHYAVERKVSEMMKWLVELRGERSQHMVADEIGMSQSGYASIETGARRPSVKLAKRIAAAMGFDWTKFYEDDEDQRGA